ncbi:MOSC domain-containing protein [Streptomyces sp. NPDC059740]|uniref:MOSC domain-containing protein n=1 Tax=Streptomyces sp. NPDC059740 TaxID=3346926 RepID=UPI003660C3B6
MSEPRLRAIHLYPVKSLAGREVTEACVEPWGLRGDRRWMLVDPESRQVTQRTHPRLALVRAQQEEDGALRVAAPGMPPLRVARPAPEAVTKVSVFGTPCEALTADEAAGRWFGTYLDAEVRLVHMADPATSRPVDPRHARPGETVSFADGFPLLLVSAASLTALNSLVAQGEDAAEGPLPMSRFRPNLVVDGPPPWAEDGWRRVRVGEVTFRVVKPSGRCVVTTVDQLTAERGREPLRSLARHRRFGDRLVFGQNLIPDGSGTVRVGDRMQVLP